MGNDPEPLGSQVVQCLLMGDKFPSLRQLEVKNLNIQLPLCADLGVQLPEGPGGGVPRIRQQGLSLDFPLGVQLLKDRPGHIDFSPDDEPGQLVRKDHGNRTYGL